PRRAPRRTSSRRTQGRAYSRRTPEDARCGSGADRPRTFLDPECATVAHAKVRRAGGRGGSLLIREAKFTDPRKVAFHFYDFDEVEPELQRVRPELAAIRGAEVLLDRGRPLLAKRFSHPADVPEEVREWYRLGKLLVGRNPGRHHFLSTCW